jgi:hypothetical protein
MPSLGEGRKRYVVEMDDDARQRTQRVMTTEMVFSSMALGAGVPEMVRAADFVGERVHSRRPHLPHDNRGRWAGAVSSSSVAFGLRRRRAAGRKSYLLGLVCSLRYSRVIFAGYPCTIVYQYVSLGERLHTAPESCLPAAVFCCRASSPSPSTTASVRVCAFSTIKRGGTQSSWTTTEKGLA